MGRIESVRRVGEHVVAEDAEVGVLAVEDVVRAREQLDMRRDLVRRVEIEHRVAADAPVGGLVVLVAARERRAVEQQVGADLPARGDGAVDAQPQRLPGNGRDARARGDGDVAVLVGRRVVGAVLGESVDVGRGYEAVACDELDRSHRPAQHQLDALAPGAADVAEVAGVDRVAGADELDIVVGQRAIRGGAPAPARLLAARTDLHGARQHLLQRRIGQEAVRQLAGRQRVGAGELDGRRRAHAFVVARITGECSRRIPVGTDGRAEAAERVIAVEARCLAALVADVDGRVVEAPGSRHRPLRRQRQRVHHEDRQRAVARLRVGLRLVVSRGHRTAAGVEIGRLRLLREARPAEVAVGADHPSVRHSGHRLAEGELEAGAVAGLRDVGAVVQGLHGIGLAAVGVDAAEIVVHVAADVDVEVAPHIGVAAQQDVLGQELAALERQHRHAVLVQVGKRVGLTPVVQEGLGQRLRPFEAVVGRRQRQVQVGGLGLVAELAEQLFHAARVVLCPAVLLRDVAGDEPVPVAGRSVMLELHRLATERSARELDGGAGIFAAALGVDRERATQRVQAEDRIRARNELDAGDRRLRQQVPVDDVSEWFVDAHAVLEHRQPLRHPEQRRRREAAEADVGLVRIALRGVDRDTGRILLEEFGEVALPLALQFLSSEHLHVGRHVAQGRAQARQRRRADHLDALELDVFSGIVGRSTHGLHGREGDGHQQGLPASQRAPPRGKSRARRPLPGRGREE